MGKWEKRFAEKAQSREPTKPTEGALGGFVGSLPSDISTNHSLSSEAKSRLRTVVDKLTADCVHWYRADTTILEHLSDEALEFAVLEYLARREWYERRQTMAQ